MRIVAVNEAAVPVRSEMRNAVFSFADMTTSVVAVVTDAIRDGKAVVGYAFNSTGRYACGAQMRDRFIPRIRKAPPDSLLERFNAFIDDQRQALDVEGRLTRLKHVVESAVEHVVNLIVVYVIETLLLPLGFLVVAWGLVKQAWRRIG